MRIDIQQPVTRTLALCRPRSLANALMRRLMPSLECGRLVVDTPTGEQFVLAGARPGPHARVALHSWRTLWRVVSRGDMGFAEAYIAGECSSPALVTLLRLALRNTSVETPVRWLRMPRLVLKLRHALNRNTRGGSRRNIAAHYDLGNEFYAQWLDDGMSYSSALFSSPGQSLEDAQNAKLDRVCDLLETPEGGDVLEIGCGWGSLAERIVARDRCRLTGITLSAQQLAFAQRRLAALGLQQFGDLRLQDYRDVGGSYDRIVSIEMLEAVGAAYWPTYFERLKANLKPGGIAVIQVITIDGDRFESYRRRPDFIQKYIFPGGMLPTTNIVEREIAAAGLQLQSAEFFGDSYALTLAEWQRRFQQAWPTRRAVGFDERFKRAWEYYLAYCQAGFEAGTVNVGLYKIKRAAHQGAHS
jgi:cyclopropane-fatty-acyl-phospholipid synthase